MDTPSSISRSLRSFFAGTLLSRVMGMTRDISMAFCFGSAPEVAAFMVAYRLAHLFRRLLGEANLQAGFVPQFERLRMESEEKAAYLYRDLFAAMWIGLIAILGLGGLGCLWAAEVLKSDIPRMTFAMMPGVLFLCLYALNSAVLQCQQRYFLPAFAPVVFNAVWIIAALFLRGQELRTAMFVLSGCVVGAFALQWIATCGPIFVWLRKTLRGQNWFAARPFSQGVRSLLKPLAYGIVGIGAAQINSAFDAIFARLADPSGPAYLWYAIRIQQLPLALFGIALASALLPPLARSMQSAQFERFREQLLLGLKQSATLMIPCAVGMGVLALSGVDLLYGHGNFGKQDVAQTALCLSGYALGLVPMVYVLLLANGFYAQKEYRWPMRCSVAAVVCNLMLNSLFVFIFQLGPVSISLATAFSSFLNCMLLAFRLRQQIGTFSLWRGSGRITLCSLGAACVTWFASDFLVDSKMLHFLAMTSIYIGLLLGLAYLFKVKELFSLARKDSWSN